MSTIKEYEAYNNENNKIRAELNKELVKGPVKYQWEIVIKPHFSLTIMAIFLALCFAGGFIYLGLDSDSLGTVFSGAISLPIMFYISRYLLTPNVMTTYKVMPLGIVLIKKDCIPEAVFKVIRILAWGGVITCLLAVFIVGPMAFVGAGGSALMAFQLINAQPLERTHEIYFLGNYKLSSLSEGGVIRLKSDERNASGIIYFQKKHTKKIDKLLKQYINITEHIEFASVSEVLDNY